MGMYFIGYDGPREAPRDFLMKGAGRLGLQAEVIEELHRNTSIRPSLDFLKDSPGRIIGFGLSAIANACTS